MDLNEFGSLASIISLVLGIVLGVAGCKYSSKTRIKNNISDVDNRKGKIKQE